VQRRRPAATANITQSGHPRIDICVPYNILFDGWNNNNILWLPKRRVCRIRDFRYVVTGNANLKREFYFIIHANNVFFFFYDINTFFVFRLFSFLCVRSKRLIFFMLSHNFGNHHYNTILSSPHTNSFILHNDIYI